MRETSKGAKSGCRVCSTLKSLDRKVGTHALDIGVGRILKVLVGDTIPARSVTNTIAIDANINRLGNPIRRDTTGAVVRNSTCARRRLATVTIDIASEVRLVLRVTNENHPLDSVKVGTGELRQGIDSGSGTLRISFEDETGARVGCEGGFDLADDVRGALGRVLRVVGGVDSVVLGPARDGGEDVRVHGAESGRGALSLTGAAGVDDDVAGTSSSLLVRHGLHCADRGKGESGKSRLEEHCEAI